MKNKISTLSEWLENQTEKFVEKGKMHMSNAHIYVNAHFTGLIQAFQ